jgi:fructose-1,6-bisphosphatase/inositol monophosphatase family enzyme
MNRMALEPRERIALDLLRAGQSIPPRTEGEDGWVEFGLYSLLSVVGRVRMLRPSGAEQRVKEDGSPATALEHEIEATLRQALERFAPQASFLGEESGGVLRDEGWTVAVDPIDGTYAYLGHTETFASVMAIFRDGEPRMGFVASPLTGEVGYAEMGRPSRLIRLDLLGEGDQGVDLPLADADPTHVLVNLHPARQGAPAFHALTEGWRRGRVRMVRAPGGSPSWALLGAARGHFTYVNRWEESPAAAWDLVAGVLLVRGAGGEVVDLSGEPIDPMGHAGPFVAGVRADHRERVLELLAGTGEAET